MRYRCLEPLGVVDQKKVIVKPRCLPAHFIFKLQILAGETAECINANVIPLHPLFYKSFQEKAGGPTLMAAYFDHDAGTLYGKELLGKLQKLTRRIHVGVPHKGMAPINECSREPMSEPIG
jgi:hypothetical protein